jgi:hypothetical protein
MDDKSLLELCLKISGSFESGAPDYTAVTGNFDGMGLSCGILQWCAGQGSLQNLVLHIGNSMGWDKTQSFFSSDIHHFAVLKPAEGIQWCVDHYITTNSTSVDPGAKARWVNFLGQPESVAVQVQLATNGVLYRAKTLAAKFCPDHADHSRTIAFFFDLVTQSGGMENQKGHVDPLPSGSDPDISDAIALAQVHSPKCAAIWQTATAGDLEARNLLYYAYHRSLLSNPLYQWDATARRGSIGCRGGIVHGAVVDFTSFLD